MILTAPPSSLFARPKSARLIGLVCATVIALSAPVHAVRADEFKGDVKHDESPALSDAARQTRELKAAASAGRVIVTRTEHAVRPVPLPKRKGVPAPALKMPTIQPKPLAISPGLVIDGIGDSSGPAHYTITHAPPDTNGSVGENDYVQWVNEAFAIFDKRTGTVKVAATDGNALWQGFGGNCEVSNDGDPITLYDKVAARWIMTQFAVSKGPPFSQCIAISKSSDPSGAYYRYEFQFQQFNDYPKFGVWPDGYYASFNMFSGDVFVGAKVCAFDRQKMLGGQSANMRCFDLPNYAGLLPADIDGTSPPPSGSPAYFVNFGDNELNLWRFKVDWVTPANSQFSGPVLIPVAAFVPACAGGDCIPQPKSAQKLSSLADRMMYRLAYRKFADHESLVVNHTVQSGNSSGVRWYELRDPGGAPAVFQQGTIAPDSAFRWMGSIAMDKMGNILAGYSVSSAQIYPSIRYTGRLATDPPNVMSIEKNAVQGKGSQDPGLDRWGDYSSVSLDPSDDCTLWFTTQYLAAPTGSQSKNYHWDTKVLSVKFNNCQGT